MLPLADDNRGRRSQPMVTWGLIAINLVVYLWQWSLSDQDNWQFLERWAVFPANISDGTHLYTLVTCAFLHGSWFHLGSNMLFLWIFGDNVEDVMGHIRYGVFYLLTAIAASGAQVLIDPHSTIPMVGASGAISGVMAAYIVLFPHGRIRTALTLGFFITVAMLPAWMMIGYWFVLQVLYGSLSLGQDATIGGGTAFWAHIGGFVAGLVLVRLFARKDRVIDQRTARLADTPRQTWGMGGRR